LGETSNTVGCVVTLSRTYRATDACGNSADHVQTISYINDTTVPNFTTTPNNLILGCNATIPAASTSDFAATDACGSVDITYVGETSNTVGCVVTLSRTYRATDACGNSSDHVQTISYINDNTAPTFTTTPNNLTLGCNATIPAASTSDFAATDACGSVDITYVGETNNTVGCVVTLSRTYRATDACGNSSDHVQTISYINDNTAPNFTTTPNNLTLGCNATIPAAFTSDFAATDACGSVDITYVGETNNTVGCVVTLSRTYRATDACGNSSDHVQTISYINDNTAPTFTTTPNNLTLGCNATIPAASTSDFAATDACGSVDISYLGETSSSLGCTVTLSRTYRATDACGNSADYVQTISYINDNTAPTFTTTPNNLILGCNATIPAASTSDFAATDACGSVDITYVGETSNTLGCIVTLSRTYRATDACGNSSDHVQTISYINDNTAPTFITTPNNLTLGCNATIPAASTSDFAATDACGSVDITYVGETSNTLGCTVTLSRTYRATDACGNSSDHVQTISYINDNTAPTFITTPNNLTLGCNATIPAASTSDFAATDACGSVDITYVGETSNTVGCIVTLSRTYRATDACGNSSDHVQTISYINDNTAPNFTTTPNNLTLGCNATIPAAFTSDFAATDACGSVDITYVGETSNTLGCTVTLSRTYRATDACGNSSDHVQTISYINDTTAPTFTTTPNNLVLGCNATIPAASTSDFAATDACGSVDITYVGETSSSLGCTVTLSRTYRATDACGNSSDHVQTISYINDNTAPNFTTTPNNLILGCNATIPAASTSDFAATDACGSVDISYLGETSSTLGCTVTLSRTYRATDACGNSTDHVQTISYINDNTAPTFTTTPNNLTLGCNATIPAASTSDFAATDACGSVDITYVGETSNTLGCTVTLSRTYRATDACGNSSDHVQTISYINDTTAPIIYSAPQSANLGCYPVVIPAPNPAAVHAYNTCGGTQPAVLLIDETTTEGEVVTITRVYQISDMCGNSATHTQVLTYNYCCQLNAGAVVAPNEVCADDGITVTANFQIPQMPNGYVCSYCYCLVDNATNLVMAVSPLTATQSYTFAPNSPGNYKVYGFLVRNNTAIDVPFMVESMPIEGQHIDDAMLGVITNYSCYDIAASSGVVVVRGALSLYGNGRNVEEGNNGGLTPFYYNTHIIHVLAQELPLQFNWNNMGYVRYDIAYQEPLVTTSFSADNANVVQETVVDAENANVVITIYYADNATWNVTISNASQCDTTSLVFSNNEPIEGEEDAIYSAGPILDIDNYSIIPQTGNMANGEIDITVTLGLAGIYSYEWTGPNGFTATTEDIEGLSYGWYSVTVTCAGQQTEGWYWVPKERRGRGKTDQANSVSLNASPNPFREQTTIHFNVLATEWVNVSISDASGRHVATLYDDVLESGTLFSVPFDYYGIINGVYFVTLRTKSGYEAQSKLMIVK
jgi:hypothetical protein